MVATNSVKQRTGNVSAGTSVFAMLVLEKELQKVYEEIDMVTTPSGDAVAMGVVFVATFAGLSVKHLLSVHRFDARLTVAICAFISSVLAAADGLFSLGGTPQLSVGTSVLYLVPGIPFINAFCDMIDRHYICAFGRLMNAIVLMCCLSAGLCAGMLAMNIGMF